MTHVTDRDRLHSLAMALDKLANEMIAEANTYGGARSVTVLHVFAGAVKDLAESAASRGSGR